MNSFQRNCARILVCLIPAYLTIAAACRPILGADTQITDSGSAGCLPAAEYLVAQYQTHNIIAIDEGPHGTIQIHQFLRQLLQNETVASTVQCLIIEFANIVYQPTLDRFIRGDEVPEAELRLVWRQTTQSHSPLFECPVYLELLNTIRTLNRIEGRKNKIRVLAGDPKIDWAAIKTQRDYFGAISQRDVLPSQLAITYGIDSAMNVLLIYGGEHLSKLSDESRDSTFWTIPYFINKKHPGSIVTIGSLATESHPTWANRPLVPQFSICDLAIGPLADLRVTDNLVLRDRYDAVYYAGPSTDWQTENPLPIDSAYWRELDRRSRVVWGEGIDSTLIKK